MMPRQQEIELRRERVFVGILIETREERIIVRILEHQPRLQFATEREREAGLADSDWPFDCDIAARAHRRPSVVPCLSYRSRWGRSRLATASIISCDASSPGREACALRRQARSRV